MRRALLILALAAPALAAAQLAGEVTVITADGDDKFINIAECDGVGETGAVSLTWNVTLESGSITSGVFRIFGSNKSPSSTAPKYCQDDDPLNGTFTKQIGADVDATVGQSTGVADRPTADFVTATTFPCTEGAADQTIHVCVQYHPDDSSGTPGTRIGWAIGTLTLSLKRPAPPTGVNATPGDGALNVSWTAGTGGDAATASYRVIVKQGTTVVKSADFTATSGRITGLENEITYDIEVFALSESKNTSLTPATGSGTPKPVEDFWDFYQDQAGAREQGGCAAGSAGPLALLGVAGLLTVLRRRK